MRYTIELNYNVRITEVVDANDEGEALDKARSLAEEADMSEFTITNENETHIISRE